MIVWSFICWFPLTKPNVHSSIGAHVSKTNTSFSSETKNSYAAVDSANLSDVVNLYGLNPQKCIRYFRTHKALRQKFEVQKKEGKAKGVQLDFIHEVVGKALPKLEHDKLQMALWEDTASQLTDKSDSEKDEHLSQLVKAIRDTQESLCLAEDAIIEHNDATVAHREAKWRPWRQSGMPRWRRQPSWPTWPMNVTFSRDMFNGPPKGGSYMDTGREWP